MEMVRKDFPASIGTAIENAIDPDTVLSKAAYDVQALWQADVNVDTGAYKNSIHVEDV